jgi:DNA modification methylase
VISGTFSVPMLHDLDLSTCKLEVVEITSLRLPNRQLRSRDQDRIESIADRIREHRAPVPPYAFQDGEIAWGADILEAYRLMGVAKAPVLRLDDRPPGERSAVRVFLDTMFAEGAADPAALKIEIETVLELAPAWIETTHLTSVEVDYALHANLGSADVIADPQPVASKGPHATKTGDLLTWTGGHRMVCGDAREPAVIERLMAGATADVLGSDIPYGTPVANISGHHQEWKAGSGMSDADAEIFHQAFLAACLPHLKPGAPAYMFMDWKGLLALLLAAKAAGLTQKSLCTWDKQAPGQGGLYRNQSEHIYVGQHGARPKGVPAPKRRRGRTTIWKCPGYASFRPDRKQARADHACTKPLAILMDLLQDATQIGDVCLDPFGGSGSIMMAAQRVKRRCYSVEIDEGFCDIAVRRMFELTGEYPVEETTGLSFEALAEQRGVPLPGKGQA